jgi:hypothetical protein
LIDIIAARPHIEAALKYGGGTHDYDDVVKMVEEGKAQFWPGPNSAIITEVSQFPKKRVLHYWLAGGNLAEIERMIPAIEEWGRAEGCNSASMTGRLGWQKVSFLKRGGWNTNLVVMDKDF